MSWGERSCKKIGGGCRSNPTFETCNVDCPQYEWDGKTEPDSQHSLKPGAQVIIRDGSVFRIDSMKKLLTSNQRKRRRKALRNSRMKGRRSR